MATLEKIRSKSVLLFTIIIVALLAFIMGDFLTSGRSFFGPGDTVASANGAKVDYNTYSARLNEAVEAQRNQERQTDNDVLGEQVINQLLVEALLNKEYDRMGITVTDKQLSDLMLGEQQSMSVFQALLQQFGQQGAQALYSKGIMDTRAYYDAMNNPGKYGLQPEDGQAMKQMWGNLEKDIDQSLRSQAYVSLVQGLFTASAVDAKAIYNDRNTTSHFAYVRKDFSSLPDKDVKITDEDYQKVYDEHKGAFKLSEEQRTVNYIIVPIVPSEADYTAGQKEVEAVIAGLNAEEGTTAVNSHPEFVVENGKYTRAEIMKDSQMRNITLGDSTAGAIAPGMVRPIYNMAGSYVIAKVLDEKQGVDNMKFSAFAGTKQHVDSLKANLSVADFDSIARANGGQTGIELSLVNPKMQLTDAQKKALAEEAVGQIFTVNDTVKMTDEKGKAKDQIYSTAFLITERDAPVAVYDIAKVSYSVIPSQQTVSDLNAKFHAFVANNANTEAFAKNAEKSGYQVQEAVVSPSTPLIGNAPSSRGAVKWAMNNKKGKVSPVFSQSGANDYLMAVAVEDIYDGKYLPVTSKTVRDMLKPVVLADKKAEKLIAQYAGKAKDLKGYASLMGEPVAQADAVFGEDQIGMIGFGENELQGKIASAKKGAVVGPFKGNNSIYVITVEDVKTAGRPYNFEESAATFGQKVITPMMQNPLLLLVGNGKIENNILNFTADQVN